MRGAINILSQESERKSYWTWKSTAILSVNMVVIRIILTINRRFLSPSHFLISMDIVDEYIIDQLKKDSRTPFLQMAKALHVSEGTIRKRVGKLTDSKVIRRFTVDVAFGFGAVVCVKIDPHVETSTLAKELSSRKVDHVMVVTGRYDLICLIEASSTRSLNEMIEKIRSIKGVQYTETFTILDSR
jgi:Lrp/AsnC family transcriptional regulator, regulator for asnA, asnC and gidA